MSRRQKGPTPEELIAKLDENLIELKENTNKKIDDMGSENKNNFEIVFQDISSLKQNYEIIAASLEKLQVSSHEQKSIVEENQNQIEKDKCEVGLVVTELQERLDDLKQNLLSVDSKLDVAIQRLETQNGENFVTIKGDVEETSKMYQTKVDAMKNYISTEIENIRNIISNE